MYPAFAPLVDQLLIAVDAEYADDDHRLTNQSDVACIPPVSGGSAWQGIAAGCVKREMCPQNAMIKLIREPIDYNRLVEQVRSTMAGAVVLFLGTAREVTGQRRTESLDYEAYEEMASRKLTELEREARQRWPVVEAALVHRLGHLEPGEVSVAVAVSCPHRDDAFEAGRFLIDRIKEVVPIWKKENWADGTSEWMHPGLESAEQPTG
jgi:molybdopterin synthase catalytic subunit